MSFPTVELTTQDPWTGRFVIPIDGVWRFTFFAGNVHFPNDGDNLVVYLKVDGSTVASSYTSPHNDGSGSGSYLTMTINSLQSVTVGQTVTIEVALDGGAYIYGSSDRKYTHWTGVFMGPST